jgi:GTP cyclohydrolase I
MKKIQQVMENKRRKITNVNEIELAHNGFSNGISTQLSYLFEKGEYRSLNKEEKQDIINEAALHYGKFLTALGCDWKNDPNSMETPMRVAKAYVNDLWSGRYNIMTDITSFPSDGYGGIILERDIPIVSQCSHHHQTILGKAHVAYVSGKEGKVIGLSKLNRIVEHFARRGAIQEQLTVAIHNAVNKICEDNLGVMVLVHSTHNCVSCRGIKHMGASMITSEVSGVFADHNLTAKQEVMEMLMLKLQAYH